MKLFKSLVSPHTIVQRITRNETCHIQVGITQWIGTVEASKLLGIDVMPDSPRSIQPQILPELLMCMTLVKSGVSFFFGWYFFLNWGKYSQISSGKGWQPKINLGPRVHRIYYKLIQVFARRQLFVEFMSPLPLIKYMLLKGHFQIKL